MNTVDGPLAFIACNGGGSSSEIDMLNRRIYDSVNNGVYKCGLATTQGAYDEAIKPPDHKQQDAFSVESGRGLFLYGLQFT